MYSNFDQVETVFLLKELSEMHSESKKVSEHPWITAKFAEQGIQASRPRVARLMRKAGFKVLYARNG
ncbi:IS3 family transposase [Pedobacter aquatilis]|uniref:IS3 family transposase n=1 Tax=Pedobacter aquatilis TaxID=351343 RepID=UPI0039773A1A